MGSSLAIVVLSVILYFLNAAPNRANIFIFEMIFMALLAVQTALLPSLLCDLYPSTVRYSCIGLSSNLCDSIIGGLTPIATFYLMRFSANANSFMLIIIIAFLISLIPFSLIKYRDAV